MELYKVTTPTGLSRVVLPFESSLLPIPMSASQASMAPNYLSSVL